MFKFYKLLFFFTMVFGSLMAISSYSWMSMWMGLEINLLSIIPLLKSENNLFPSEAALKYFLTQALASSILLFSIILLFYKKFLFNNIDFCHMMFSSALLMKMGAAPFHFWFPEVLEGLDWNNCLIMLTWQKIAPMIIISYNFNPPMFLMFSIILSTMVGGVLGLNQISLRKILAYSSINHISWMLSTLFLSQMIWLVYFTIYTIISLNLIFILKAINSFHMIQLFNSLNSSKIIKFFFILNFLSLGGLPPFLGFFPKWLVINNLIFDQLFILAFFLIVFTLITLFYYLRITFSSLVIYTSEAPIQYSFKLKFMIFFFNFISIAGLLASTLIFNYI